MRDSRAHSEPESLSCMEIWGGNEALDSAVSVAGIDAWVCSRPHGQGGATRAGSCGPTGSDGEAISGSRGGGGGDVHYVSMCACGEIGRFFLADISGHGQGASRPAVEIRLLMRKYINTVDQTAFVGALNDHFTQWSAAGRFATAVLTTYFAPTREFLVCNAGHPPPLWYRADRGTWEWLVPNAESTLNGDRNFPIGIVEHTQYAQFAVKLGINDRVILYSDAAYEARSSDDGEMLGRQGLLDLAQQHTRLDPAEQAEAIVRAITERSDPAPLGDDLTLMLLHHHGKGRTEKTFGERLRAMGKMLGLLPV